MHKRQRQMYHAFISQTNAKQIETKVNKKSTRLKSQVQFPEGSGTQSYFKIKKIFWHHFKTEIWGCFKQQVHLQKKWDMYACLQVSNHFSHLKQN